MLKIIKSTQLLDFGQLMYVYSENNGMNGMERYPNLSRNQQLLQAEQDFYAYLKSFFRGNDSFYAVWAPDGRYASALRIEPYRDGLLLEGLETAPALRRRGYAKRLLYAVVKELGSSEYAKLYSHIDKRNTPSLLLHESAGFKVVSDLAVYVDGSVSNDSYTLCHYIPDLNCTPS